MPCSVRAILRAKNRRMERNRNNPNENKDEAEKLYMFDQEVDIF